MFPCCWRRIAIRLIGGAERLAGLRLRRIRGAPDLEGIPLEDQRDKEPNHQGESKILRLML